MSGLITCTPCRLCARLPGCEFLTEGGQFCQELIIDEQANPVVCGHWEPMGVQETRVREAMYEYLGTGYLRGLHMLPRDSLKDAKEGKEDMVEVPDFAGMVRKGMTAEERIDQLLYETDDQGNFLTDQQGGRVPRGELPVRKYASQSKGPVGPPVCDTIAYWDFEKVLDEVLRAEKRLGWIVGSKKAKKTTKPEAEPPKPVEEVKKKEEGTEMTVKPKIMLRRPGQSAPPPAATASEEKADKTPGKVKGKITKAATNKPKAANGAAGHAEPAAEKHNEGGISAKEVEKLIAKAIAPLDKKIDTLIAAVGVGPGKRSVADTTTAGLTVLHDSLHTKLSNLFFGLCELTGVADKDTEFPFLAEDDGRDKKQNLLEGEGATDIISYYLDGVVDAEPATEGEEGEEAEGEEEEETEE